MKKFLVFVLFALCFNLYGQPEIVKDADGVSHVGGLAPLSKDFYIIIRQGTAARNLSALVDLLKNPN